MAYGKRALFEAMRSIDSASIGAAYTLIGDLFENPVRMLYIVNNTDALLQFSIDGVDNHFVIMSYTSMILDVASNRVQQYAYFLSEANGVYVAWLDVPTTGDVYVSVVYGKGD